MQTRLRRRIAAAAIAVAIPAVAACGFNFQTDQVYQPAPGVNNRSGEVDVLGALVVSDKDGSGVFVASLSNNNPTRADQLTGFEADGAEVSGEPTAKIPGGGLVNLAAAPYDGITITGSKIKAGGYITVRLTFSNASPVTMSVPIFLNQGPYESITPSPTPTATPSDDTSASAGATESPDASATPAG